MKKSTKINLSQALIYTLVAIVIVLIFPLLGKLMSEEYDIYCYVYLGLLLTSIRGLIEAIRISDYWPCETYKEILDKAAPLSDDKIGKPQLIWTKRMLKNNPPKNIEEMIYFIMLISIGNNPTQILNLYSKLESMPLNDTSDWMLIIGKNMWKLKKNIGNSLLETIKSKAKSKAAAIELEALMDYLCEGGYFSEILINELKTRKSNQKREVEIQFNEYYKSCDSNKRASIANVFMNKSLSLMLEKINAGTENPNRIAYELLANIE